MNKKKIIIKKNNPYAKILRTPMFKLKVKKNDKKYNRKKIKNINK